MLQKNFKFVFYDYETFGINPCLDKPFQFSCIKTDFDFNILSSNVSFFCLPPIDYLPNIESIFITQISPLCLLKKKYFNEYFFAKKIYKIFIQNNTCIVGYNNFYFDDEFTRNIFYRNFFDPYSWSWKNNNSRIDILIILRAYYSFRPENIVWPKNKKNGLVSFKLSDFTKNNNISHKEIHNAKYDVYATVSVAKFLKKKNKGLFLYLFKNRFKKNILQIIYKNFWKPIFFSSSLFHTKNFNLSLVLFLFIHPKNSNIAIMFNLTNSVSDFINYFNSRNCKNIFNIKDLFSFGILFIYLNKSPVLAPLSIARKIDMNRINFSLEKKFARISKIRSVWKIFLLLKKFFFKENLFYKKKQDVDLMIYSGFLNSYDKQLMYKVHDFNKKKNFLKKNILFDDDRMNKLFFRFKARHFKNLLTYKEKIIWKKHCFKVFNKNFLLQYIYNLKNNLKKYYKDKKKIFLIKQVFLYMKYVINIIKNY
ncbi:exodeoxyribonuclease I [Buchnera aphidicola (Astegopteryx bambusae)]|uniref:exodeoxyribonuclease I n=1 Tax=Buchnera aphidicola TaxID=9 RepID=UPI0031B889DF